METSLPRWQRGVFATLIGLVVLVAVAVVGTIALGVADRGLIALTNITAIAMAVVAGTIAYRRLSGTHGAASAAPLAYLLLAVAAVAAVVTAGVGLSALPLALLSHDPVGSLIHSGLVALAAAAVSFAAGVPGVALMDRRRS